MNKKPMLVRWRLQTLPDAVGVAMLVEQGVLTVKEARFILLGETEDQNEQKKEER